MKVKAFLILMVVTVATVMLSAELGERWFAPGMERAVFIGIVTCLVVFPLSRFFEYIGWVKGSWNVAGDKNTGDDAASSRKTAQTAAGSDAGGSTSGTEAPPEREAHNENKRNI